MLAPILFFPSCKDTDFYSNNLPCSSLFFNQFSLSNCVFTGPSCSPWDSLIEAVVYADAAAKHALSVLDRYEFNHEIPEWNAEGTVTNEEMVLITQSMKEVNQIMGAYVGIVRSDLRLKRAWVRLDMIYEETEDLFKRSKASRAICELRNMVNVGYLITRQAIERKESRGLHYTIDYPHAKK